MNPAKSISSTSEDLLKSNQTLIHSSFQKVTSHVQREEDEWIINTLMIEGCDTPFQYKRKKLYQSLKGAQVDITYYCSKKEIGGLEFETFNIVRIRRS